MRPLVTGQFENGMAQGMADPTQLPTDPSQAQQWQRANRSWWEGHPMRYDWTDSVGKDEFSREFFQEIDERFLKPAGEFLPYKKIPFDSLIDFEALKDKDVLEIGVGNGSHAALLAAHARSFTGIDLTDYATRSTGARFKLFGLNGTIRQMDAEKMDFPDGSFDFIWSWGVIHHSSNTRRIVEQMHRVLRPGGKAVVMVYNRSAYLYWFCSTFIYGVLRGRLFKYKSLNAVLQSTTDGALARYYKGSEWRKMVGDLFDCKPTLVSGNKPEFLPIPGSGLKRLLLKLTPNLASRFFLNTLRQGSFLIAEMTRKG